MAFCKYCGHKLEPEHKFCGGCGTQIIKETVDEDTKQAENAENIENTENTENTKSNENTESNASSEQGSYEPPKYEPITEEVFEMPAKSGKLSVGMLVWSIINTLFSFCCCLPIGIVPLVFAVLTNNADYDVSRKNRKRSLICNIIVSALMLLALVVIIVAIILGSVYSHEPALMTILN